MLPLIPYSDDTSGNKSKIWNKYDSWCLKLAGMPNEENQKFTDIFHLTRYMHVLCSYYTLYVHVLNMYVHAHAVYTQHATYIHNNNICVYMKMQVDCIELAVPNADGGSVRKRRNYHL